MKIPKEIKIGENNYKIKKVRVVNIFRNVAGDINYGSKKMRIRKLKDNKRTEQDIFFHEMAHGFLKELEFNYPNITKFRNDEEFVQELGLLLRKTFLELLEKQND